MPPFAIETRQAIAYVGLSVDVTMDSIPARVDPAFEGLVRYLDVRGIVPLGPSILRYRRVMMTAPFTLQIGLVVDKIPWIDHPYVADWLPAGRYVVARQDAPYASIGALTSRAMTWGDGQGVDYALEVGREGGQGDGDTWESWYEWYPAPPTQGADGPEGPVEICLKLRD
ncbi:hypothetical protein [Demequina sp. NBRC 110057]|uniref:hypothetical protein n=1 Tax=Demequina sp. NBRC 110057 TaxID=1570346 RepID=UPI0009FEBCE7|nr:hypothetical protein [Demequina sp. NBRC 110057]